jgi:branched-subunit amino acid transport protein AzlD
VAVVVVSYKLRHSTFLSIILGTGAYMALVHFFA